MRKFSCLLVAGIMAFFMAPGLSAHATGNDNKKVHKSYVCKYVGTPGEDERLQTGKNPIWVDNHALLGYDGKTYVGQEFKDKHGKSVVIVANTKKLDPEPSVNGCPSPEGPPSSYDECANLAGNQPEGFECFKQDLVGENRSEGKPDCEQLTVGVYSTPWKQVWTFTPDADGGAGSWSLGEKQYGETVLVATREATDEECPNDDSTPVLDCDDATYAASHPDVCDGGTAVEPTHRAGPRHPVAVPTAVAAGVGSLPNTGVSNTAALAAGAGLMVLVMGSVLMMRRTPGRRQL